MMVLKTQGKLVIQRGHPASSWKSGQTLTSHWPASDHDREAVSLSIIFKWFGISVLRLILSKKVFIYDFLSFPLPSSLPPSFLSLFLLYTWFWESKNELRLRKKNICYATYYSGKTEKVRCKVKSHRYFSQGHSALVVSQPPLGFLRGPSFTYSLTMLFAF